MENSKPGFLRKQFLFLLLFFFALLLIASLAVCGGGGGGRSSNPPLVAPQFKSTPPSSAQEGVTYTYNLAATDPNGGTVSFSLKFGPSGAIISGSTLTWTPTHAQSRTDTGFTVVATASEGTSANQSFSVNPNGNISGVAIDHLITANGLVNVPEDLNLVLVEALVSSGSGFTKLEGSTDLSGHLTVPNVPAGPFWLHLARRSNGLTNDAYFWTSASDIDLGWLMQSRPDAVPETAGVTIGTNIPLANAAPTDSIAWTSPDANAWGTGYPAVSGPVYVTSFAQMGNLIDATKGDRAYFLHYSGNGAGLSVIQEFGSYQLTETDGGWLSLTGPLTPIAHPIAAEAVIKVSQFDAVLAPFTSGPSVTRRFLLEDAAYEGSEGYAFGIPLVSASFNNGGDVDLGPTPFGLITDNGVPYVYFQDTSYHPIQVASQNFGFEQGSLLFTNVVPQVTTPIVPVLGEPGTPAIDGKDFLSDQSINSKTPTITWSAPALGTPAFYALAVFDVSDYSTSAGFMPFWRLVTDQTSMTLPSGILQAGKKYAFILTAVADSAAKVQTAPHRHGSVYAQTSEASGAITVSTSATKTLRTRQSSTAVATSMVRVRMLPNGRFRVEH